MMREDVYKTLFALAGAAISYFFGGWPRLLEILVVFIFIDYVTGVLAAGLEGQLSSLVGLKGIAKKITVLIMIAVAHLIDQALGGNNLFRDAAIFFYLANELLSILENTGRIGLPVPSMLRKAVLILKNKGDKNGEDDKISPS